MALAPAITVTHQYSSNIAIIIVCFVSGKSNVINPPARHLFKPTQTSSMSSSHEKPRVSGLVNALYTSIPTCMLQYIDMNTHNDYPPDTDFNVGECVEVETSSQLPPTLPALAAAASSTNELMCKVSSFDAGEIKVLEEQTRRQSDNPTWKSHLIRRITASVIHHVKTKVKSLQKKPDTTSATTLVRSISGQSTKSQTMFIPALE